MSDEFYKREAKYTGIDRVAWPRYASRDPIHLRALDWIIDRLCILRHGKNLDELMWGDP